MIEETTPSPIYYYDDQLCRVDLQFIAHVVNCEDEAYLAFSINVDDVKWWVVNVTNQELLLLAAFSLREPVAALPYLMLFESLSALEVGGIITLGSEQLYLELQKIKEVEIFSTSIWKYGHASTNDFEFSILPEVELVDALLDQIATRGIESLDAVDEKMLHYFSQ